MTTKRNILSIFSIVIWMLAAVLFLGMHVNAATVDHKNVKIYFHTPDNIYMKVKKSAKAAGVQVELQNSAKKKVAAQTSQSGTVGFDDLDTQKIYYYRVREYTVKNNKKQWDAWSSLKPFSTCYAEFTATGKSYSLWVNTPKAAGVAKYEIWMSSTGSLETGFSKIGTVTAGQRLYMSKLKGKAFKSYKKGQEFYVFLKPILSKGSTRGYYCRTGFAFDSQGKPETLSLIID